MRERLKTLNDLIAADPDLMDDAVLIPEAVTALDAAALKLAIVRRCGDVEPYYQDHDDFVTFSRLWFNTHDFLFNHAVEIWEATYNPIENYDRSETETITDSRSGSDSNTDTHSGTDSVTTGSTSETGIAGFNSLDYADANEITESGSETTIHGHTITTAGSNSEEGERERSARIHGNIGVTTAQQMLEAEMELARHFWIYDYIANAYETDNFLTVYKSYFGGEQWSS